MKNFKFIRLLLPAFVFQFFFCIFPFPARCAGDTAEFSAIQVIQDSSKPGKQLVWKIHVNLPLKKMRVEKNDEKTGEPVVWIQALDSSTSYLIHPKNRTYSELPGFGLSQSLQGATENPCENPEVQKMTKHIGGKISCRMLGTETVSGFSTHKWEEKMTDMGHTSTSILWIEPKLKLNLRTQTNMYPKGVLQVELRSMKFGHQAPSLFMVPAGYKKVQVHGMFEVQGGKGR